MQLTFCTADVLFFIRVIADIFVSSYVDIFRPLQIQLGIESGLFYDSVTFARHSIILLIPNNAVNRFQLNSTHWASKNLQLSRIRCTRYCFLSMLPANKHSMASEIKRLTELISTGIHRLNEIFTETLFGSTDCHDVWKLLKQLIGIN